MFDANGARYQPRGHLGWDHCHEHNIVRGTLCTACNNDEATDLRLRAECMRLPWDADRFTEWRRRCHLCE